MSKKSNISVPVTSSKPGLNPNTPTYNPSSFRWQSTYPIVSHQLALPATSAPPGLWTPIGAPITAGYGYSYPFGQPRFAPPPPLPPHSNYCCLANQRHQCGGYDHNCNGGWPAMPSNGSNCWSNNHNDNQNNNSSINGVAITEVKDDSKDESDDDSTGGETKDRKRMKELQQINRQLICSLEESKQKLKETEETLLKLREVMPFECLEYYRHNLKKYGDFIRQEVNRFYQNEEMAQKLKPIVEQISNASHHIKEEKERTRQSNRTTRQELKDNKNPDLSVNLFSPHSLPEFPDLLTFYKNILDEIPLIFLNDLSQLKRLANNFIQTTSKNKLSNNGLPITSPFGDEPTTSLKQLSSKANALFSAPNISDLPKPDFNTLPLKPAAVEPSASPSFEFNFTRNLSPIPLSDSIIPEPNSSSPLLDIIASNNTKEKPLLSPICKPVQPVIDLKAICAETVKNSLENSTLFGEIFRTKPVEMKLETDPIRAPMNPIPRFTKSKPTPVETESVLTPAPVVEAPNPELNRAQSRLLVKLREKYSHMSDYHLIESMAQTKAVLIASGNPMGFTGMKIAEIVGKISDYIDSKVLTNSFSKPRLTEMKSSVQSNIHTIGEKLKNTSLAPSTKKGWNTLHNKTGKFDDTICSICFESISVTTRYETECQHFFHHSCINNWIRTDGSCPICRRLVLPPGEFPEL